MSERAASPRILLVEDEANLRASLAFILEREGFLVVAVASGEEALEAARAAPPALVVLDVNLPGIDGYETCDRLRQDARTAAALVVMVTARAGVDDILHGFEKRADDYVTKPFQPKVLLARIQALLRRGQVTGSPETGRIEVAGLSLDAGSREARVDGRRLDLTRTEFDLLALLVSRPNQVFSRGAILDHVRGDDTEVTERAVDFQVSGLRRKLGDRGALIETVRGLGYKLGTGA